MGKPRYRIGTRGTRLTLAQTQEVIELLRSFEPEAEFLIEIVATSETKNENGGHQVEAYTEELQKALIENRIDIAVHSAKDLPTDCKPGTSIAAYTHRIDPREVLVSHHNEKLTELPQGAIVGVNSLRRRIQIARLRPDLKFAEIYGTVESRIRKVRAGEYHGIITANAALIRLGLNNEANDVFPLDLILPAAGQGAVALQCRHDDLRVFSFLELANYQPTAWAIQAERMVLKQLELDRNAPIGVSASYSHEGPLTGTRKLRLQAALFDPETNQRYYAEEWGEPKDWINIAESVANQLKKHLPTIGYISDKTYES